MIVSINIPIKIYKCQIIKKLDIISQKNKKILRNLYKNYCINVKNSL